MLFLRQSNSSRTSPSYGFIELVPEARSSTPFSMGKIRIEETVYGTNRNALGPPYPSKVGRKVVARKRAGRRLPIGPSSTFSEDGEHSVFDVSLTRDRGRHFQYGCPLYCNRTRMTVLYLSPLPRPTMDKNALNGLCKYRPEIPTQMTFRYLRKRRL